jgi:hypothetical protein
LGIERCAPEGTPGAQVAETARTAAALAALGFHDRARDLLAGAQEDGLGYAGPAKRDAQYVFWRGLLRRACEEDPGGRAERLGFFARLLDGLSRTEGEDAARRLVPALLGEAAQAGAGWARAAADRAEEVGLVTFPNLVVGLLAGAVKGRPDLTACAGVVFGRVALPLTTEHDADLHPRLVADAPLDQVDAVARHAILCLETDGHPKCRVGSLRDVVAAGAKRGIDVGGEAVARWAAELGPDPHPGRPEGAFAGADTLEELAAALERAGGDAASDAVRAFERIVPAGDYEAAKALYERTAALREDDRSIDAIATAAVVRGRRDDAEGYARHLEARAEDRGAWGGGWRSDARFRHHRLQVRMRGEPARRAAFAAFVADLARGREHVASLMPDFCEVLELVAPGLSWAECWSLLQEHLGLFRDYRLGREMGPAEGVPDGGEHTVADVLFRAVYTTASEPTRMVRAAARELLPLPGGAGVAAVAVRRLWLAGGEPASQAAQIAWECRHSIPFRDAVVPWVSEMVGSDDCAVRRTAAALSRAWGQVPLARTAPLPAVYRLELPPDPRAGRFEPPSGISPTSSGLWTEDPFTWTWPLEEALTATAEASGLQLANLRHRAAQLMARMGGRAAFGPEAVKRQQDRFRRLRLHVPYRKLGVSAAFRAMREVAGELAAADAIDAGALPSVLRWSAALDRGVYTTAPSPRPPGVLPAEMPDRPAGDAAAA